MITFLRHFKLQHPYDWWKNMSFIQFCELAEGRVEPHISGEIYNYLQSNFTKAEFSKYHKIICGESVRAKETASDITISFHLTTEILSAPILNEVPSIILSEVSDKEFEEMKHESNLKIERKRVLSSQEKINRIQEIVDFLEQYRGNDVLVISHSYLIGLLNYYYCVINQNLKLYDEIKADNYEIGGYLEGFSVEN